MKILKLMLLMCIICIKISLNQCSDVINMTAYYQIPKLYKLDDYDRCLNEFPNQRNIYCYVDVTIAPNRSNTGWRYIEKISADKKHFFRHDRLKRGLCLERCEKYFKNFVYASKQLWYQPLTFDRNISEIKFDRGTFKNSLWYRNRYNRLVNICVNKELKSQYEMMAYSEIIYCDSRNSYVGGADYPVDNFDILFLLIVCSTFILTAISSVIDHRIRKRLNNSPDHYKLQPIDFYTKLILSFSLYRNCYRIIHGVDTKMNQEIKVINAMRFLFMYTVILGHTILVLNAFPTANPEYMEENFHRLITMLLINGQTIIQTFYTITGFLAAVKFLQFQQKIFPKNIGFTYLIKGILFRYFRLTPVYAFMILFNATWLIRLDTGPLWRYGNEVEREHCRANWWTNLLFINNYVKTNEPCVQQGWYLGTDFQLFSISLFLLILIAKMPMLKRFVLIVCIAFSVIVPAIVTYKFKFDGILIPFPEAQKYVLWYDDMYQNIYIPTHTNTGSYLTGIIGGWLWYYIRRDNIDIKTYKTFKLLNPFLIPTTVVFIMSGYIFYAFEFEKPAIWISCYSSFAKNYWGVFIIALIIGLSSGIGGLLKYIVNSNIFNALGRITFCTYIVHVSILRLTISNLRQPNTLSDMIIFVYVSSTFLLSYLAGFALCLIVEIPCSNLLKLFVRERVNNVEFVENEKIALHTINNSSNTAK